MKTFLQKSSAALLTLSLLLQPLPALAAQMEAQDYITTPDNSPVSRGDFIRAAVEVLGLAGRQVDTSVELPYRRVAKGIEKHIRIADDFGALDQFGYDLLLAQGITRGQALILLSELSELTSSTVIPFKDVRKNTPDENAVRVAIDKRWMSPIRETLFGVRRMLTGSDARLLLRKVSGEAGTGGQEETNQHSQTIKVNYESNKRIMNLPKTQILETIWTLIQDSFLYDENIDIDEAAYNAAEGLVKSVGDKYTTFMRPAKNAIFQTNFKESSGIGATVEHIDGILTIISPLVDSPAEAAGLQPGDKILKVNGEPLEGLSFIDAVTKVRGPKGSTVTLTINRSGIVIDVKVVRDVIKVPEFSIRRQGDTLIIQLTQFGRLTQDELRTEITKAMADAPKGVVLDMRNNPGGLLGAAITVVGVFLPKGTPVVDIRTRKDRQTQSTVDDQLIGNDIPLVVLVNEGSASASEIVAGALKDHKRATIVGSKTFGKGTVQQVLQFNDGSGLKMTIAEWYSPNGTKINGVGVHPTVGISKVDGRDAPLLKAFEILRY